MALSRSAIRLASAINHQPTATTIGFVQVAHTNSTYDVRLRGQIYPHIRLHAAQGLTLAVGDGVTLNRIERGEWLITGLAPADLVDTVEPPAAPAGSGAVPLVLPTTTRDAFGGFLPTTNRVDVEANVLTQASQPQNFHVINVDHTDWLAWEQSISDLVALCNANPDRQYVVGLPLIPTGESLADAAAGTHDSHYQTLGAILTGISAGRMPHLRLGYGHLTNLYPWSIQTETVGWAIDNTKVADFALAWQKCHDAVIGYFETDADPQWVFTLDGEELSAASVPDALFDTSPEAVAARDSYPGDTYVDVLGLTVVAANSFKTTTGAGFGDGFTAAKDSCIDWSILFADSKTKPWAIDEFSIQYQIVSATQIGADDYPGFINGIFDAATTQLASGNGMAWLLAYDDDNADNYRAMNRRYTISGRTGSGYWPVGFTFETNFPLAWKALYDQLNNADLPPTVDVGGARSGYTDVAVALEAVITDDLTPVASLSVTWTVESGPGAVIFDDHFSLTPFATAATAGVYVVRCTVNDGAQTAFDELTLTVTATAGTGLASTSGHLVATIKDGNGLYIAAPYDDQNKWGTIASRLERYRSSIFSAAPAKEFAWVSGFANRKSASADTSWGVLRSTANNYLVAASDASGPIKDNGLLLALPLSMVLKDAVTGQQLPGRSAMSYTFAEIEAALSDSGHQIYQMWQGVADDIIAAATARGQNPNLWLALRIAWECNGNWYNHSPFWKYWDESLGDGSLTERVDQFKQIFRLTAALITDRVEATLGAGSRPLIIWNYAGGEGGNSGLNDATKSLFPGADVVDAITVDQYQWYGARSATDFSAALAVLDSCAAFANLHGLPMGIDETGIGLRLIGDGGYNISTQADGALFITGLSTFAQRIIAGIDYPNVDGWLWNIWFQGDYPNGTRGATHKFLDPLSNPPQLPNTGDWPSSPYRPIGDTAHDTDYFPITRSTCLNLFGVT